MKVSLSKFDDNKNWIDKRKCNYCHTPLNCAYNPIQEVYFLACGRLRGKLMDIDLDDLETVYHFRFSFIIYPYRLLFEFNYSIYHGTINSSTYAIGGIMPFEIPKYWQEIIQIIKSKDGSARDYVEL